jgi:hypothetical protein
MEEPEEYIIRPNDVKSGGKLLLSPFDQFSFGRAIPMVWFYRATLDTKQLTSSLEKALINYPVVCGRYCASTLMSSVPYAVDLSNEGVPVQICHSPVNEPELTLEEAMVHLPAGPNLPIRYSTTRHESFVPSKSGMDPDPGGPEVPILKVRITLFPNGGGTAIGVLALNGVLDANSTIAFMNNWAHAHGKREGGPDPELEPFHDRYMASKPNTTPIKNKKYDNSQKKNAVTKSDEANDNIAATATVTTTSSSSSSNSTGSTRSRKTKGGSSDNTLEEDLGALSLSDNISGSGNEADDSKVTKNQSNNKAKTRGKTTETTTRATRSTRSIRSTRSTKATNVEDTNDESNGSADTEGSAEISKAVKTRKGGRSKKSTEVDTDVTVEAEEMSESDQGLKGRRPKRGAKSTITTEAGVTSSLSSTADQLPLPPEEGIEAHLPPIPSVGPALPKPESYAVRPLEPGEPYEVEFAKIAKSLSPIQAVAVPFGKEKWSNLTETARVSLPEYTRGNPLNLHLSKDDVVTALCWRTMVSTRLKELDLDKKDNTGVFSTLIREYNIRERTNPPLGAGYCGNGVDYIYTSLSVKELLEQKLHDVALFLRADMKSYTSEDTVKRARWLDSVQKRGGRVYQQFDEKALTVMVSSWRFNWEGAKFGSKQPIGFDVGTFAPYHIILVPRPKGDGLNIHSSGSEYSCHFFGESMLPYYYYYEYVMMLGNEVKYEPPPDHELYANMEPPYDMDTQY